jgi:hypothetical protein
MNRRNRLLFLLPLVCGSGLMAQTAEVSGLIKDSSGSSVPKAAIRIQNMDTGTKSEAISNQDGFYDIPFLKPGLYEITVEAKGFKIINQTDIRLSIGASARVDFNMEVGQPTESVTVTAEPSITDAPAVATVVDRQLVENLPLNGRSFQSLVELTPGIVLTPTNVTQSGQFSVNGQRANANYFTIDGVSANFGVNGSATLYESAGGTLPAYSALGGTNNLVSVDAVQEFRIQTSTYAPEFGRQPGAQFSMVTRSGTNDVHGTAFDYLRNDVLDANDYFANRNGLPRPALRQNDFGFTLGAPVYIPKIYNGRNRTFFFASYEGLRLVQPAISSPTFVPTVAARQSATGVAASILNAFPLPNGPVSAKDPGLASFVGGYSSPSTLDATSFRIDQSLGSHWTLFGRFNYSPSQIKQRAVFSPPNLVTVSPSLTRTVTLGATAALRPNLINDIRFNQSRSEFGASNYADNYGGAVVPPASLWDPSFSGPTAFGSITIGAQPTSIQNGLNAANVQRQINFVDTASWTIGTHALKFGIDYRRLSPIQLGSAYRELLTFSSVAQVQAQTAATAIVIATNYTLYPVYNNYSAFAQDTWRIAPRLTVTYGIRYELNPAPTEQNGNQPFTVTGLNNFASLALAPKGTSLYQTPHDDFAPRVGFAYNALPGRGTVIRGGFGLFYDLGYAFTGSAYSTTNFPFAVISVFPNVSLSAPSLNTPPGPVNLNPPYGRLFAYGPGYDLPYTLEYNLTVEQPFGKNDVVSVAYVGAGGHRLGRVTSLRNPTANLGPTFTRIDLVSPNGISNYNSLQLQFRHRLAKGLQALASYTLAKSLDEVSDESIIDFQAPSATFDPRLDYGPSSFDIRHSFSSALSYSLPSRFKSGLAHALVDGWGVDMMIQARSGTPVNILTGRDLFGLGFATVSRPNVVPGQLLILNNSSVAGGRQFNPAALSVPPTGVQGNLGRNVLRGFAVGQVDFSLRREFPIHERLRVQFRADAFNLFDHPNFANPDGVMTDPTFGLSTQMLGASLGSTGITGGFNPLYQIGGPRSYQLAAKFVF